MNKNDFILVLIIVCFTYFGWAFLKNDQDLTGAVVKYEGDVVLEINLKIDQLRQYQVAGANGKIIIEAKKGAIRVVEETSPYNICSKKGWATTTSDVIICLPNLVVIELIGNDEIDTIIY